MLNTPRSCRGMVTSPHHLASQAGLDVLKAGGTAIEAAVATAAALAVVYPHMTGIGGDAFWLTMWPDGRVETIDACGAAAQKADPAFYHAAGLDTIPWRGPLAANTVAGTVSGWDMALSWSHAMTSALPLGRVLRDALYYAEQGVPVTDSAANLTRAKFDELKDVPGFRDLFTPGGRLPQPGDILHNPRLAKTLRQLADEGLSSFYRGNVAREIAADLNDVGSPLALADLQGHRATHQPALHARIHGADLYNLAPPTQGVASLLILALFDRLKAAKADDFDYLHGLVEATKQAFRYRDTHVGDPAYMTVQAQDILDDRKALDRMAASIDPDRAAPWPWQSQAGDTVWLGVIDSDGLAVSMIQSLYFEYGSGVVLPRTGIVWQNRGTSFGLDPQGWNGLRPGRKPFHTLNPAGARFDDGRTMVYGTMGGEGQPQTQSAIFTRYARYGMELQEAVTAPRWLLGRTWGESSVSLKYEDRFDPEVIARMQAAGHQMERVEPFSSTMGHAGALVRHGSGLLEGATDPRSDGCVAAW
ncbi:gamma-glutamyltransferase family protein [Komagataeibacter intermedius]|uniref:Gamma-glutamyltransferase n=2 Tax=Komagataeibacter intermedius TaxID=66229 RepID=A0A0N1FQ91_9PROT|nr:gamma-glutamyltransferase family protein [Komagataeibacter intermedius]KPH87720.1 gamma-glutamyltransferase [Komagataeibacter intermedius AF2]MCF3636440.1 gamma-glutamyltransferase family protein [Komagataeibacter intermedius]GAN85791.1 gamma-glutamyltranspeptidase [Komagataeibacter intermedius TF2]GBQ64909.1 gamma-glutamyltranspeptidase [Komagataeibacter intermedius NRIC 0521]